MGSEERGDPTDRPVLERLQVISGSKRMPPSAAVRFFALSTRCLLGLDDISIP